MQLRTALELEAVEAADEAICGSALDWRKAFDHVRLRLLCLPAATRIKPGHIIQAFGTFLGASKGWQMFDFHLKYVYNLIILRFPGPF